jgi:spermidine synthase
MTRARAAPAWFFPVGIFAAAFLLFAVQPMVGKRILPWFGGAASVWSVCLAFYQTALLLGYAYAHGLAQFVPVRLQPWLHAGLFAAALAVLPVLPDEVWKPAGTEDASLRVIAMLLANVALPFALLAATGPLVQAWFARGLPDRSPYVLYAVSNLGSLLALVSYPILIEPAIPVSAQSALWSMGFAATGALVIGCGILAAQRAGAQAPSMDSAPAPSPARSDVALWLLLPAAAVALFMGVSNRLCLDVASVPFLWIVPLSIYLVTLILAFASERFYRLEPLAVVGAMSALVLSAGMRLPTSIAGPVVHSLYAQVALYSLALFCGCMIAHGELYRLRPVPARLTSFYLSISAGGALGGLFVALVAPRIFSDYHELPLAVALTAACAGFLARRSAPSRQRVVGLGIAGVVCLAALGFQVTRDRGTHLDVLLSERNFYGVLSVIESRVSDDTVLRMLRHGTTLHGSQTHSGDAHGGPPFYYGESSGMTLLYASRSRRGPVHMGVAGLGTGAMATYGREGDRITFYEIDSDIVEVARTSAYFTFLADSPSSNEVVVGDARLALESEPPRGFDILVLDAFSSDAIPMHLLTAEAFDLYDRHLQPDGALAVHVSSRFFSLTALVAKLGDRLDMDAVEVVTRGRRLRGNAVGSSRWVLLSRDAALLRDVQARARARATDVRAGRLRVRRVGASERSSAPLWTDDYSDLLGVVR